MDRIVDVSICCIVICTSVGTTGDGEEAEDVPDDLSYIFTDAPSVHTAAGPIIGSMGGDRLKTAS